MNPWISHMLVGVIAFGVGFALSDRAPPPSPDGDGGVAPEPAPTEAPGVTGLGGVFFKSENPAGLRAWYLEHLAVGSAEGAFAFQWLEKDRPAEVGYTVWGVFPSTTGYFDPTTSPFMINFRVTELDALLGSLRDTGVQVVGEIEEHPNGKFAWILDPEGRKIELWEPVPSAEDPYL